MEIKQVFWDINDLKVSGIKGYNSVFFKKVWVIIGEDICKVIKEFFVQGKF